MSAMLPLEAFNVIFVRAEALQKERNKTFIIKTPAGSVFFFFPAFVMAMVSAKDLQMKRGVYYFVVIFFFLCFSTRTPNLFTVLWLFGE